MRLEHALAAPVLDVKAISETGEFTGVASPFGNVDSGGDIVKPGAFAKSLRRRPAAKVKLLRGHDMSEPIGVWTELKEDTRGLIATGRLILETTKGRETHALMKAGALDSLSIGYLTVKASIDRITGARILEEVDLYEVSVVSLPMNEKAVVTAVKEHSPERARRLVAAINAAAAALRA